MAKFAPTSYKYINCVNAGATAPTTPTTVTPVTTPTTVVPANCAALKIKYSATSYKYLDCIHGTASTGTTVAPAATPKAIVVPANTTVVVMTKDQLTAARLGANNLNLMAGVSATSGTYPALTVADLNGPTAPATNPCYANLVDGSLTDAMVAAQYPGQEKSPKLLTPQEYQCWEFLKAHPSTYVHPSTDYFTKIYKNEPYLMML